MEKIYVTDFNSRIEITEDQKEVLLSLNEIKYCDSCGEYHPVDDLTLEDVCGTIHLSTDKIEQNYENSIGSLSQELIRLMSEETFSIGSPIEFTDLPKGLQDQLETLMGKGKIKLIQLFKDGFAILGKDGEKIDMDEVLIRAKAMGEKPLASGYMQRKPLTYIEARRAATSLLEESNDSDIFLLLLVAGILNMKDRPLAIILDLLQQRNPGRWDSKTRGLVTEIQQYVSKWVLQAEEILKQQ